MVPPPQSSFPHSQPVQPIPFIRKLAQASYPHSSEGRQKKQELQSLRFQNEKPQSQKANQNNLKSMGENATKYNGSYDTTGKQALLYQH